MYKPFKIPTLFQAVRGLFTITWKAPSRDRENPRKKKKKNHTAVQSFPILTWTGYAICFSKQGIWLQVSKCNEQPCTHTNGDSLLSCQPKSSPCQENVFDDWTGQENTKGTVQYRDELQGSRVQHWLSYWLDLARVTKYLTLWYFSLPWMTTFFTLPARLED